MSLRSFMILLTVPIFSIACADSVTEDFVAWNGPPQNIEPFTYPTSPDRYENDDTAATAGLISVGVPQWHSLYPVGDEDWVRVELEEGVEYEFSASHLSVNGDTWLYLYDTDAATVLADNDDCIGYDSCIQYTPDADGVYYLRVDAYANQGLMSYRLEARLFNDADDDGWSPFYDCNDADNLVHPKAVDIAGDGEDQNCTATDALVATVPDAHEDDHVPADATIAVEAQGGQYEFTLRPEYFPAAMHTLDFAGDADWFKVEVGPHQMVLFEVLSQSWPFYDEFDFGVTEVYVPNTPDVRSWQDFNGYLTIANDSETQKTVDVRVKISPDRSQPPFSYLAYVAPKGHDIDMDGYGTMGMWGEHDCDDGDPAINNGAVDTPGDGIDQNCDGVDGVAPSSMPREGIPAKHRK